MSLLPRVSRFHHQYAYTSLLLSTQPRTSWWLQANWSHVCTSLHLSWPDLILARLRMKTTWPLQEPTGKWRKYFCAHVSPGGQESAKRENGGTRVCQKVCITSVNTLPCRIKTTSVAEGKKETMVSRITHTLKKKPDGGFTSDYFVETKYSHARNQWIIFVLTSCFADKGNNPSCCHLRFAPLFSSRYIVSHLIDWGILFYMEYNFL